MITTYDDIRALGGFKDVTDAELEPFVNRAVNRLKKIVGEIIYADAAATTPENAERAADLKMAEAYFVLYYALSKLNMVWVSGGGIAHQGQVGDTLFKFHSPKEIEEQRQMYLNEIDSILSNWLDTHFNPTIGISEVIEEEDE